MKGFYQVTETIKNQLLSDANVNNVTTGDITKIDLSKQTMFPLSHIIVNNVNNEDNVLRFSLSVLSMDIVDVSKEAVVDIFRGNDNEQDILNTHFTSGLNCSIWSKRSFQWRSIRRSRGNLIKPFSNRNWRAAIRASLDTIPTLRGTTLGKNETFTISVARCFTIESRFW